MKILAVFLTNFSNFFHFIHLAINGWVHTWQLFWIHLFAKSTHPSIRVLWTTPNCWNGQFATFSTGQGGKGISQCQSIHAFNPRIPSGLAPFGSITVTNGSRKGNFRKIQNSYLRSNRTKLKKLKIKRINLIWPLLFPKIAAKCTGMKWPNG